MNVAIRPWTIADAESIADLADDFDVARWMTGFPLPFTPDIARNWILETGNTEPARFFAIVAEGEIAGGCGIEPRSGSREGVAIVGYWLGRRFWGRGIATATLRLLVDRGREFGFRRLQASVFEPNVASARVLEKCGFSLEGRLKSAYVERDGNPVDELIYGLVLNSPER